MKVLIGLLLIGGVITLVCYIWPQINFREMPKELCTGKLNAKLPNWVSSQVDKNDDHYIDPLKIESLAQLADKIKNKIPGVTLVEQDNNRILAYRQSTIFHFTDWICIEANGNVTSTATLGYGDFNQNRKLVESIRQLLKQ